MWRLSDDDTESVITAREQIHSAHRECALRLPATAIVFFMGGVTDYLNRIVSPPARKNAPPKAQIKQTKGSVGNEASRYARPGRFFW